MPRKQSPANSSPAPVEAYTHDAATRRNIPTAEMESVVAQDQRAAYEVRYPRNPDLDPQIVWRGKDQQDWRDLVVHAPPLYIQEKVNPKALIDDLLHHSRQQEHAAGERMADLFADFDGIPHEADKTEFYTHEQNWTNRMILGDSLSVMASLAEREGLRGKVQCIYFDPPYGIKFNSNFQWSTTTKDVKDGNVDHITRQPEQVKAFRDTWRDGIHSYLTYLRDRLSVARDLLTDSGSIFVQIGDENVHRVRALMDEVFGDGNFIAQIASTKTAGQTDALLPSLFDSIIWFARNASSVKFRRLYRAKGVGFDEIGQYYLIQEADGTRRRMSDNEINSGNAHSLGAPFRSSDISSNKPYNLGKVPFEFEGRSFLPPEGRFWTHSPEGRERLRKANRIMASGKSVRFVGFLLDDPASTISNQWTDTGVSGFAVEKVYVVQTSPKLIERCMLMATDPGDLVLDPTCGSGTTATVAEQWGRRWITIDTSRVALALARARIMGARYPYYLLADSREGQQKEATVTRSAASTQPTSGNLRHGFVYERVPHITLKAIANNAEIDVIWEAFEARLVPLRAELTALLPLAWLADYRKTQRYTAPVPAEIQEWEVPRELPAAWPAAAAPLHARFWQERIARQQEIDASIAAKAEFEYLYDKPYENKKKIRVAGPFTVESLSPHRTLGVDENDNLLDPLAARDRQGQYHAQQDFVLAMLEALRAAGVQQSSKEDRIRFTALTPWPGKYLCAEGTYLEGEVEKRAAVYMGPEFGTVQRADLVDAAREAGDANFDVLIACGFNFEAHTTEFSQLGRLPVLKARMNADLHMAEDLKNTGAGNLFMIFGEPDFRLEATDDGRYCVKILGVDVFDPAYGKVRSDSTDGIACWFLDTNYNGESFFVRHAYFLGANDPYNSLRTSLKAEINREAWETLYSDVSRPFAKPKTGRVAVKVINHLGDEVMKVFRLD
ncbi:MAG: DNA methyltransferase [Gammaproteobacteria bacterium]|nr:DNA methyltransferase [Gammaproteobacteria bacterium]